MTLYPYIYIYTYIWYIYAHLHCFLHAEAASPASKSVNTGLQTRPWVVGICSCEKNHESRRICRLYLGTGKHEFCTSMLVSSVPSRRGILMTLMGTFLVFLVAYSDMGIYFYGKNGANVMGDHVSKWRCGLWAYI